MEDLKYSAPESGGEGDEVVMTQAEQDASWESMMDQERRAQTNNEGVPFYLNQDITNDESLPRDTPQEPERYFGQPVTPIEVQGTYTAKLQEKVGAKVDGVWGPESGEALKQTLQPKGWNAEPITAESVIDDLVDATVPSKVPELLLSPDMTQAGGAEPTVLEDQGISEDGVRTVDEERLDKHMRSREGVKYESYNDSLNKPTGGIGHLLTKEEKVKYPVGTDIPKTVVDAWYKEDIKKSREAATKQADAVPNSTGKFEEALVSMNFQLGTEWTEKFPTAWKHMKAGNYTDAADELRYTKKGSGVSSDWYKQTPKRVEDAIKALEAL
jgi:GH24 family phage-related lysozyme (muramidase)